MCERLEAKSISDGERGLVESGESEPISGGNNRIQNYVIETRSCFLGPSTKSPLSLCLQELLSLRSETFPIKTQNKTTNFPLVKFVSNSLSFPSQAFYFHSNCPCQQLPMIPLLFDKSSGLSSGPFCLPSAFLFSSLSLTHSLGLWFLPISPIIPRLLVTLPHHQIGLSTFPLGLNSAPTFTTLY